MAGGFLSGLLTGAVVSGAALGVLSVVSGGPVPHAQEAPEAAGVEVPAGSEFNRARVDAPATIPEPDGAPQVQGDAPQVGAVAPDDLSAVDAGDTAPAARPDPAEIDADLSAPQVPAEGSGITPSLPDGAADLDAEGESTISEDPAQPELPEVETGSGLAEATEAESGAGDEDTASAVVPENALAPEDAPAASAPEEEAPAGTIGNLATNVETGRLPSVGSEAPVPEPAEESAETAGPEDSRAITRNAASFENPEGKPLLSIVLIDDGTSPIGLDALAAFPYPLSFAVDAAAPGAAEAMARYRNAGFEVLAIADLPEGADPRDTETVMQTVMSTLPEAVAILEGTGSGLQISRDASEQLAPILLESGHGLVLFAKGLGTAPKLIAREGVPVGTVFRDFDANGQNPTVIRRFLDQAAFKAAREEGGVIMLGRLRADTISALLLWGLQDRASSVAVAPVSAVLLSGE
ncbi:divergent polysaccharide deacteylase family protein [Roseovarius aquimarinus]|uniref:Divergent polysaccharide deacetylase family protein n=1 Tax=Roseovarius aquimarinus TaxID=1229156 RepID=A0ABW7I4X8_9RHOB